MTVLPSRLPYATAVTVDCRDVAGVTITSSSGIRCTGEKKCMPEHALGVARRFGDARDRNRARVRRVHRRRVEHRLDLGEHLDA